MATEIYPPQAGLFFIGSRSDLGSRRLGWTVAVSLFLHLCVLAFVVGIRFTHQGERPLASVEVSLVSMPVMSKSADTVPAKPTPAAPAVRPGHVPAPIPMPVKPADVPAPATMSVKPADAPAPAHVSAPVPTLPKPAPVPAPAARGEAQGIKRAPGDVMRDVLRGIELPPDAPQFGDLSPSKPVAEPQRQEAAKPDRAHGKLRRDLDSLIGKLKVPELRTSTETPVEQAKRVPTVPDRSSSISEEADRELEKELKRLQAPPPVLKISEPVKEATPQAQQEAPPRPTPAVTATVPNAKVPETALKVRGSSSGSSPYLARVQAIISSRWTAPPVDVSGQSLAVVIRFRLDRSGRVSGVTVERSSGNDYYDIAGQRAVMSAGPLPVFPPEMTDLSLDAHFTFSVGEQQAG